MLSVAFTLIPGVSHVPLLFPNLGTIDKSANLFLHEAFHDCREPFVNIETDPSRADYLLLPHNYSNIDPAAPEVRSLVALSQRLGKRILVFWHGDSDAPVALPNALVLRTCLYASRARSNEIAMPAYAADLLQGSDPQYRAGGSDRPVVGFCGWAGYPNLKTRLATYARDAAVRVQALGGGSTLLARQKGITWRQRVLDQLAHNPEVILNAKIRQSYSGHRSTIRLDPLTARQEYIANMAGSDLALAVKGDGNYSYRFYEALSAGRVPLLLDTDCVLPLETVCDYQQCVIRVPFADWRTLPSHAARWWRALQPGEFPDRQRRARALYTQYLAPAAYLRYAVASLLPQRLHADPR